MAYRFGNQQRHSLLAVMFVAAVTLVGLTILDRLNADRVDPLENLGQSETVDAGAASEGSSSGGPGAANAEYVDSGTSTSYSVSVAPSPAVDTPGGDDDPETTAPPATRAPTTAAPSTTGTTGGDGSTTETTDGDGSTTETTDGDGSTTETTDGDGSTTETTVDDGSTTITLDTTTTSEKKCRGRNPNCEDGQDG